jgi:hypothetical protein
MKTFREPYKAKNLSPPSFYLTLSGYKDLIEKAVERSHIQTGNREKLQEGVEAILVELCKGVNPKGRRILYRRVPELKEKVSLDSPKEEVTPHTILEEVSRRTGLSPSAVDDLYGAVLELLWSLFSPEEMEELLSFYPVETAMDIRASRPGEKRGSF